MFFSRPTHRIPWGTKNSTNSNCTSTNGKSATIIGSNNNSTSTSTTGGGGVVTGTSSSGTAGTTHGGASNSTNNGIGNVMNTSPSKVCGNDGLKSSSSSSAALQQQTTTSTSSSSAHQRFQRLKPSHVAAVNLKAGSTTANNSIVSMYHRRQRNERLCKAFIVTGVIVVGIQSLDHTNKFKRRSYELYASTSNVVSHHGNTARDMLHDSASYIAKQINSISSSTDYNTAAVDTDATAIFEASDLPDYDVIIIDDDSSSANSVATLSAATYSAQLGLHVLIISTSGSTDFGEITNNSALNAYASHIDVVDQHQSDNVVLNQIDLFYNTKSTTTATATMSEAAAVSTTFQVSISLPTTNADDGAPKVTQKSVGNLRGPTDEKETPLATTIDDKNREIKTVTSATIILANGGNRDRVQNRYYLPHERDLWDVSIAKKYFHTCIFDTDTSSTNDNAVVEKSKERQHQHALVVGGTFAAIDTAIVLSRSFQTVTLIHDQATFDTAESPSGGGGSHGELVSLLHTIPNISVHMSYRIDQYEVFDDRRQHHELELRAVHIENMETVQSVRLEVDDVYFMDEYTASSNGRHRRHHTAKLPTYLQAGSGTKKLRIDLTTGAIQVLQRDDNSDGSNENSVNSKDSKSTLTAASSIRSTTVSTTSKNNNDKISMKKAPTESLPSSSYVYTTATHQSGIFVAAPTITNSVETIKNPSSRHDYYQHRYCSSGDDNTSTSATLARASGLAVATDVEHWLRQRRGHNFFVVPQKRQQRKHTIPLKNHNIDNAATIAQQSKTTTATSSSTTSTTNNNENDNSAIVNSLSKYGCSSNAQQSQRLDDCIVSIVQTHPVVVFYKQPTGTMDADNAIAYDAEPAFEILSSAGVHVEPYLVRINLLDLKTDMKIDSSAVVQDLLKEMTGGQQHLPHIFVGGVSIIGNDGESQQQHQGGGGDSDTMNSIDVLRAKHRTGTLRSLLRSAHALQMVENECDLTLESCISMIISSHPVVMFTKTKVCGTVCQTMKDVLHTHGVSTVQRLFTTATTTGNSSSTLKTASISSLFEIDLYKMGKRGSDIHDTIERMTGQRDSNVPTLYMHGKHIIGDSNNLNLTEYWE